MSIGILSDKDHRPTKNEVFEVLASRQGLWEDLVQFIASSYSIDGEWNFGGKNYGWNILYRKGGKTLVSLYPQKKGFIAQIVLGKDQVSQALKLRLGKNVGAVLRGAPQLHDGRWLFVPVKTRKDVKDIQQLLEVKRRPKSQEPK